MRMWGGPGFYDRGYDDVMFAYSGWNIVAVFVRNLLLL